MTNAVIEVDEVFVLDRCHADVPLMLDRGISEYYTVPTSGIIDSPYLRRQRFSLDFVNGRMALEP